MNPPYIDTHKIMLDFLIDWLNWASMENPDKSFAKWGGLCYNLSLFCDMRGGKLTNSACELLETLLIKSDLDTSYPFGEENYINRYHGKNQHLDPARLAWVRKTIGQLQKLINS